MMLYCFPSDFNFPQLLGSEEVKTLSQSQSFFSFRCIFLFGIVDESLFDLSSVYFLLVSLNEDI